MHPVENSSGPATAPRSVPRAVWAVVWGLLGGLVGLSFGAGLAVFVEWAEVGIVPGQRPYIGRSFAVDLTPLWLGVVGLVGGAILGALRFSSLGRIARLCGVLLLAGIVAVVAASILS
jgi:hypothetical protein